MILESKIDIPANVFGVEFSQVSIEVEEPIEIHAGIITRLLFNNSYLGSEHMVMMNVLENEDGEFVFVESDFVFALKEMLDI